MILAYHHIRVVDPTHPGEARRAAARLAEKVAFNEVRAAELSIVVTELPTMFLPTRIRRDAPGWLATRSLGIDIFAVELAKTQHG